MINVILFDADGVLINGEMFSVELERKYGISHASTQPFYRGIFQDCLVGKQDLKQAIVPYLKEWGWPKSVQDYLDEWFVFEHKVNQELLDYIHDLRTQGIKCIVATNQEKYRAEYMLDKMGFGGSFDKLYASVHLGAQKPNVMFFERLIADLGEVNREEILFWDNSPTHISGAKQAGIHAELYTTYKDFVEKMKRYV